MTPIKTARKMRGLAQSDLAARMGISPQALNQYESGARSLGPKLLPVAAQVLDVSPAYLAGIAQSIPVFCADGGIKECAIIRQESIPNYGMLYLVDTREYGAENVILADGIQYILHTQLDDCGISIDQIAAPGIGYWIDSRGHIALMVDGLPRAIETVRFNTVYRILSEKTVVGRMKAHPDELWDDEEDSFEVDRVRLRLWIDSDPIISVEAEGQLEGDDCIIMDDGTCMLLKQELIKKAEAAGIEGEFWRGIGILSGVTSSFGYMRSATGAKAGWETLYIAQCVTWNGFANARAFKTIEEARREAGKLDIRKARCKFDDSGICTVVDWVLDDKRNA